MLAEARQAALHQPGAGSSAAVTVASSADRWRRMQACRAYALLLTRLPPQVAPQRHLHQQGV